MRKITLGVYDYQGNKLIDLYSSACDYLGAAYDVEIKQELNGSKELSFTIPARVLDEEGKWMENPRRAYLRNEYIIRLTDSDDPDEWDEYFITEPADVRTGKVLELEASCEHISKRLAAKNLFLELTDDGSGVGTARELLERILRGTGWRIGRMSSFLEADGTTEKVRTLACGKKTGAYRMIAQLGELFGASPVYHGQSRTVDLLTEAGADLGVVFQYAKNLESVRRACLSDNVCTRMYVDYLESEQGYTGIERVNPLGTSFILNFSYMEHLGLITPEQRKYMTSYEAALLNNGEIIKPLILLLTDQQNAMNGMIGQAGCASLTVETLGGGSYQWQTASLYNLNPDWAIPAGAQIYCRGESLNWEPYAVKSCDPGSRTVAFAEPTQAAITRMIWFETPPAGMLGSLLITLTAKQKVLANLTAKYESETSGARKEIYYKNIEKTLQEITALYLDTEERAGIATAFAYLTEAIPALNETHAAVDAARKAQDDLTAEFEAVMGDLIKDRVYDGRDYSADQEEALYQDVTDELARRCCPEVEYDCTAVVLSEAAGYEIEQVHVGDRVRLIDQELGIDDTGYITELVFRPGSHEPPKVSIGNYLKHYTDFYAKMVLTTQQYQDGKKIYDRAAVILPDGTIDSHALEESLRSTDLNAGLSDSVHVGGDGVVVTNPLDPEGSRLKMADGALYASKDGGLTWELVLDGNGVSPDVLAQGVLDCGKLTIMDGESKAFVWNSTGLYALHPQHPDTHWIRYGKDGIAFTQNNGETYDFQICWDGVLFRRGDTYMSIDAILNEITASVSDSISAATQKLTPEKIVSTVRASGEYQADMDAKADNAQVEEVRLELGSQLTQTALDVTATFQRIGLGGGQTGIVKADMDGVTVAMQDGSEVTGSSRLGAEGLTIFDAGGDVRADFGSGDKAWIKRLITEDIDCPTVLKGYGGSGIIPVYLAPAPTGDGSGRDAANKSAGLANALKNVLGEAKHIPYGTEVQVHVGSGSYNEQIRICGYFGGGSISILFESPELIWYSGASHVVAGNEVSVTFQRSGLTASGVSAASSLSNTAKMVVSQTNSAVFYIDACKYVSISGVRSKQSGNKANQYFVYAAHSSNVSISLCDVSNCDYLARATSCAYVATHRCCGTLNTGWMFADDGGRLLRALAPFCPAKAGSKDTPDFVFSDGAYYPVGGFPAGEEPYRIEASIYNPNGGSSGGGTAAPIEQTMTTTLYASEYVSTRKNGAEVKTGICYQGNYYDSSGSPYPKYTGYARFYGVAGWCAGAKNIRMRLYVKRQQTAHGKGSGAKPCLLLPNGTEWVWNVGLARNGNTPTSTWIELPGVLVSFLAAGGGSLGETITFYASSTDNYIWYETGMTLEITAEKTL